ncbi:unnamed protein product [Mytilus edulis]|uniref:Reverse transcriptase domain-containing protein n=1 Tax=Mytilus edulis TaxID=6550 RepID=A0A8S3R4E5_MYTED|nr:unnamed protein product [Mytilus edulis]
MRKEGNDTCLYCVVHDERSAAESLGQDLESLDQWAGEWGVTFNADKTKSMYFTRKSNIDVTSLCMNDAPLENVSEHKHLGITLSSNAKWSSHIQDIYSKAFLKKRIQPKTKNGEPLVQKLGRDSFVLRLASVGEYCDDLKESLSSKSSGRNNSYLDVNVVSSTPVEIPDLCMRETIIKIESSIIEMKLTHEKTTKGTNEKLDKLETENRSMNSKINKQNERLINIQNQLNLSRSTISRLKDENSHLEKTVTDMSEKLCQSSKIHETNKNVIMELKNKVKSLDLEISTEKVQAEKSKSKLEATIKLCNEFETKSRLDSECIRITKISDSKASCVNSLRTKVQVLSEQLKDTITSIEKYDSSSSSLTSSITDIRKRINTVERNAKTNETNIQKSYAKIVSEMQSDEFLRSNIGKSKTHESVSDVLQKSPEIKEPEVEASFVKRTTLAPKNPENEIDSTQKIDVHFPRSVCNPPNFRI